VEEIPLEYKIALGQIPRIGDISARKLVAFFGSVEAVFLEPVRSMMKIPGIGETLARNICDRSYLDAAKREAEFVSKYNIKTYFYLDVDYPYRLGQCEDSPVVFFYKGNTDLNAGKILSIVGTRSATIRGREICEKIISTLAARHGDLLIVSGLAYGIDIAAHKSALKHGLPTVGVLGTGLKTIYPSLHRSTAEEMVKQGGLISDFLSDTPPDRNNFIKRNRIIAGLADATLVVESGAKGGALISADIAASYNRDVLAVPGRVNDQFSVGCNNLIKNNKAAMVESASDIEYLLNWTFQEKEKPQQKKIFSELSPDEELIAMLLTEMGEADTDTIHRSSGIPVFKLSQILLQLELKEIVKFSPGNIYRIIV
jgi:DNA processing protein